MEEVERNRAYLLRVVEARDLTMLRRNPPWTLNRDIPRPVIAGGPSGGR